MKDSDDDEEDEDEDEDGLDNAQGKGMFFVKETGMLIEGWFNKGKRCIHGRYINESDKRVYHGEMENETYEGRGRL